MEPNLLADQLRRVLKRKTHFDCLQPYDETFEKVIKDGFPNYSPSICIIQAAKDLFPGCVLMSYLAPSIRDDKSEDNDIVSTVALPVFW